MTRNHAFTLVEIMVSVAILSVALTTIFSSEVTAMKIGQRARATDYATILARCKMGEIEEKIAKDGLPAVSDNGTDICCEGGEIPGYKCDWKVERIVLPELGAPGGSSLETKGNTTKDKAVSQLKPNAGLDLNSGTPPTVDSVLAQSSSGSGNPFAEIAIQFTYPVLKPLFEDQIRRATVSVRWSEGGAQKSFDLVQFLVSERGSTAAPPPVPTP